ncbi:hypothetical protein MKW92_016574 [Papaver armeniacum]|nr:hypothetical protein MKW92_016574 [Papaver armeniacum]
MTGKTGKNRHDQRDYKYQNQERMLTRVPEAFEDIYDPVYDEYISEDNYWDEVNSVDSDEAPLPKIRYKRSSHLKEESHLISECCAKDEKKHSTSRVVDKNNSHSSISLSLVE